MRTNERKIYIYHHTDDDGYGGGAAIYNWLIHSSIYWNTNIFDNVCDGVIYSYAVDYVRALPDTDFINKGDVVFYIDYSFSNQVTKDQFKDLHNRGAIQYWLDHHESSKYFIDEIRELNHTEWINNPFPENQIYYDQRISGAMIAALFPDHTNVSNVLLEDWKTRTPKVIQYISDWDLFEFKLLETRAFHYGFAIVEDKLNIRSQLWQDAFNNIYIGEKTLIKNGYLIIEYEKMQNSRGLTDAFIVEICGREVVVLNRPGNSTVFGDAYDVFGLVMPYTFNGSNWKYSIFSKQKDVEAADYFDCEEFTKQYGGGGHKTAAGFTVKSPLDLEIVCRLYNHPKWMEYKKSLKEE